MCSLMSKTTCCSFSGFVCVNPTLMGKMKEKTTLGKYAYSWMTLLCFLQIVRIVLFNNRIKCPFHRIRRATAWTYTHALHLPSFSLFCSWICLCNPTIIDSNQLLIGVASFTAINNNHGGVQSQVYNEIFIKNTWGKE